MKRTPQQVDEMILRANEIAPEWWPSVVARGVADDEAWGRNRKQQQKESAA